MRRHAHGSRSWSPWHWAMPPRRSSSPEHRREDRPSEGVDFSSSPIFGQIAPRRPAVPTLAVRIAELRCYAMAAPSKLGKIVLRTVITLAALLAVLLFALWLKPPDLLRVGANYSAKIVCSNVFLAGRDPDEVLRTDVQAPGIALLRLMRISVDRRQRVVRAGLLGFIGDGLAVDRPDTGCAAIPDGNLGFAIHVKQVALQTEGGFADVAGAAAPKADATTPATTITPAAGPTTAALGRILADDSLTGPGLRAVVVVEH